MNQRPDHRVIDIALRLPADRPDIEEKIRAAIDEIVSEFSDRPIGFDPRVADWAQSGGWYHDLSGGGWSQSDGWVHDLNGKVARHAHANPPAEVVVRDVYKALGSPKQVNLGP